MDKFIVEPVSKTDIVSLNWLQRAMMKESVRNDLSHIFISAGKAISCDGYRIHIADAPVVLKEQTAVDLRITQKSGALPLLVFEALTDKLKENVSKMIEEHRARRPLFRFAFQPKFVIDALSGMRGSTVNLSFGGPKRPFQIVDKAEEEGNREAFVMPIASFDIGEGTLFNDLVDIAKMVRRGDAISDGTRQKAADVLKELE
jgi:hypothetical protein